MEKDSAAKPKRKTTRKTTHPGKAGKQPKKETAAMHEEHGMSEAEPPHTEEPSEEIPTAGIPDTSDEPEINPKDIPVEDLANGITNVLGEGLGLAIDSGRSVGSFLVSDARTGAKWAAAGATVGYEKLLGFVRGLKGDGSRDKPDEGLFD